MKDLHRLLNQQEMSRSLFREKLLAPKPEIRQGIAIGYDSATGRYSVQTVDGTIYNAQSITNGAIALGQKVTISLRSAIPQITAMPH